MKCLPPRSETYAASTRQSDGSSRCERMKRYCNRPFSTSGHPRKDDDRVPLRLSALRPSRSSRGVSSATSCPIEVPDEYLIGSLSVQHEASQSSCSDDMTVQREFSVARFPSPGFRLFGSRRNKPTTSGREPRRIAVSAALFRKFENRIAPVGLRHEAFENRTFKLHSGTTSEPGCCVNCLGELRGGLRRI